MFNANKHIVSTVKWNIDFDDAGRATELQSDLGNWSKVQMLKEMNFIFNDLCPPNQTWHIQELELDLGEFRHLDYQYELPDRFRLKLKEKLLALINQSSNTNKIEVRDNVLSQLQLLQRFLELGYMPWYQGTVVSVNELFLELYASNRQGLVDMIKLVGRSIGVRRRIAWQFDEKPIKQLVRELEPNNHLQILEFTTEFERLQEKENVLQSSLSDFKSNLWFWVLNHLFEERGTLFNRLDFMESTIRQMAQHFNIAYDVLFHEIELAVMRVKDSSVIRPEFITALNLLSRKKQVKIEKADKAKQFEVYYEELSLALNSPKRTKGKRAGQNHLTELVAKLHEHDIARFEAWVKEKNKEKVNWTSFMARLDEAEVDKVLDVFLSSMKLNLVGYRNLIETLNPGYLHKDRWKADLFGFLSKNEVKNDADLIVFLANQIFQEYSANKEKLAHELNELYANGNAIQGLSPTLFHTFYVTSAQEMVQSGMVAGSTQLRLVLNLTSAVFHSNGEWKKVLSLSPKLDRLAYANPAVFLGLVRELNSAIRIEVLRSLKEDTRLNLLKKEWPNLTALIEEIPEVIDLLDLGLSGIIAKTKDLVHSVLVLLTANSQSDNLRSIDKARGFLISVLEKEKHFEKRFVSALKKHWVEQASERVTRENTFEVWLSKVLKATIDLKKLSAELLVYVNKDFSNVKGLDARNKERLFQALLQGSKATGYSQFKQEIKGQLQSSWGNDKIERFLWTQLTQYHIHKGKAKRFKKQLWGVIKGNESTPLVYTPKPITEEREIKKEYKRKASAFLNLNITETTDLADGFNWLLLKEPGTVKCLIESVELSSGLLKRLNKWVNRDLLMARLFGVGTVSNSEVKSIYTLLNQLEISAVSILNNEKFKHLIWTWSLTIAKDRNALRTASVRTLRELISLLTLNEKLTSTELLVLINQLQDPIPSFMKTELARMNPVFNDLQAPLTEKSEGLFTSHYVPKNFHKALIQVLNGQDIPVWLVLDEELTPQEFLQKSVLLYPFEVQQAFRYVKLDLTVVKRLFDAVGLDAWVKAIQRISPDHSAELYAVHQLIIATQHVNLVKVNSLEVELVIVRKLLMAWKNDNWRGLAENQIWNELAWDISVRHGIKPEVVLKAYTTVSTLLSVDYRIALEAKLSRENTTQKRKEMQQPFMAPEHKKTERTAIPYDKPVLKEGIPISNAGLVLVNSFVKTLFDRLELLNGSEFKAEKGRDAAVHYLQYIVNGLTYNEEQHLVLNKVLCGFHPTEPVSNGIELTEGTKKLIDGMIEAMINYWPAIGKCTVNGFRGNWLIRDGMLTEDEDRWTLTVEKRAYDILIHQSPFSFSIIKHAWMDKPLHVNWAY